MSIPDFLKRWERIEAIPEGFTLHTDDSSPTGYPPGVTDDVRVDAVMGNRAVNLDVGEQFDHLVLWTDQHPQTFGWSITAIPSSIPGGVTLSCAVLAYRIRSTPMNLIILDKYETGDRPSEDHEFMVRVQGHRESYDLTVLAGDAAAIELGTHKDADFGLWLFGDEGEPALTGTLILNREALTVDEARAALVDALVEAGAIHKGLTVVPGEWQDFADHPEGEMFLEVLRRVEIIQNRIAGEDAASPVEVVEVTPEKLVELFGDPDGDEDEDVERAEALARGRARMVGAT